MKEALGYNSEDDGHFDVGEILDSNGKAHNVEPDDWAIVNFDTRIVKHTDNDLRLIESDVAKAFPKPGQLTLPEESVVIGTQSLIACTGLLLLGPKWALVAHFQPGNLAVSCKGAFTAFLSEFSNNFVGGHAWIFHADYENKKPVAADNKTKAGTDLVVIHQLISQLGLAEIRSLKYQAVEAHGDWGSNSEGSIMVDCTAHSSTKPIVYIHGFQQNY